MANTPIQFYRGAAPNTLTTVYTVPTGKIAIVRECVLSNVTGTDVTGTIKLQDITLMNALVIPAGYPYRDDYHQVLTEGQTIKVQAGTTSALDISISGLEVS